MNTEKIINELSQIYPGKKIIKNKEGNPTEIICEINPGIAIAVIDKSEPHYHKKITETYKVLDGELNVFINNTEHKLKKGNSLSIKPNNTHYAIGDETWVEVYSEPTWTPEDHFLTMISKISIIDQPNKMQKILHIFLNSLPVLIMIGLIPLISNDYILTAIYILIITTALLLKKNKNDILILAFGFFIMFITEYLFISTGVETFDRNSLFGLMPLWLPFLWAYGFIAIKRAIEILNS